jgi:hypothetical protein
MLQKKLLFYYTNFLIIIFWLLFFISHICVYSIIFCFLVSCIQSQEHIFYLSLNKFYSFNFLETQYDSLRPHLFNTKSVLYDNILFIKHVDVEESNLESENFYDFNKFFISLYSQNRIWIVIYFFINLCLNYAVIWYLYKQLKIVIKSPRILFDFIKENFLIKCYFIMYLSVSFFILKIFDLVYNLMSIFYDEWAFAVICTIFLFYFDLFQSYIRVEFKLVKYVDSFLFFEGKHFELMFAVVSVIIIFTIGLDIFDLLGDTTKN